ncbi:hypothetical protein ABRY95_04745 [Castellaniella ginsengisoli]|uniref:Uncharacterized protein n=1 Tax=Castellaniella ginsengisoli TaxID=546114 RepID=A0AB39G5B2_9BURK
MAIEKCKVTGVKFFTGTIDGKKIDSGKIFIEEQLDFTTGRAKGYASQEYNLGSAEAVQGLMHNPFPFVAEVEFVRVTNGDTTKNIVTGVRPLEMVPPAESGKKNSTAHA